MARLWVWMVKAVLGVAQFAVLNRLAERTGFRNAWLHPIALALSPMTGLNDSFLEILLLATITCWLVWLLSGLCSSMSASLSRVSGVSGLGTASGHRRR